MSLWCPNKQNKTKEIIQKQQKNNTPTKKCHRRPSSSSTPLFFSPRSPDHNLLLFLLHRLLTFFLFCFFSNFFKNIFRFYLGFFCVFFVGVKFFSMWPHLDFFFFFGKSVDVRKENESMWKLYKAAFLWKNQDFYEFIRGKKSVLFEGEKTCGRATSISLFSWLLFSLFMSFFVCLFVSLFLFVFLI